MKWIIINDIIELYQQSSVLQMHFISDLQSRRSERKRRSTANPQFSYGNYEAEVFSLKQINDGWEDEQKKKNHFVKLFVAVACFCYFCLCV